MRAEMVPVRRIDHCFIGLQGAAQLRDHVAGDHPVTLDPEVRRQPRITQRQWFEVGTLGLLLGRFEIQPCTPEQRHGQITLHPAAQQGVVSRGIGALNIEQRRQPRTLHRGPTISGRRSLMHDQHTQRAAACGFLILVGPAAVIGDRRPVETSRLRGLEIGIVDQHDRDLALQVDLFVIVPAALRRSDAIADEHQRRLVHFHLRHRLQALQDHVSSVHQLLVLARNGQHGGHRPVHLRTQQRHGLGPAAVVTGRLQPGASELPFQVRDGLVFTRRRRRPSFEFIRGQGADMARQVFGADAAAGDALRGMRADGTLQGKGKHKDRLQGDTPHHQPPESTAPTICPPIA